MTSHASIVYRRGERGIAMVLALFLMSALSVLAASMMFLSQTETYATQNYRMMSQARYAAEGGVQKVANYLLDRTQYAPPVAGSGGADTIDDHYDLTTSPVLCKVGASGCTAGQAIKLSSTVSASNYPDSTKKAAYAALAAGTLSAGTATLSYTTTATLLTMQYFESYAGIEVVQTWKIEASGSISAGRTATVEVMALVETPKVPASGYAAFATSDTCGALTLQGNINVDSYDSTGMSGSSNPSFDSTGGNVGSNGNLTINGNATDIYGNLYTPRTGVGTCNSASATAYTGNTADIHGSIVQLPATVAYPTPTMPGPSPVADPGPISSASGACTAIFPTGLPAGASCSTSGSKVIINGGGTELSLPSLHFDNHVELVLVAGNPPAKYDFNSLVLTGQAEIKVQATSSSEAAVVNIVGKDPSGTDIATPLDFAGGTFASPDCASVCSDFDASMLKFVYAGTGAVEMTGNSSAAATIYAPNAYIHFGGTADLYGSVIGATIDNAGTPQIHYDRRLTRDLYMAGHPAAGTFTWKRAS